MGLVAFLLRIACASVNPVIPPPMIKTCEGDMALFHRLGSNEKTLEIPVCWYSDPTNPWWRQLMKAKRSPLDSVLNLGSWKE